MDKKISIVLLNYNGADDTIACLQSLQNITYSNYRIIVVDNASPDDSMERLSDYMQSIAPDEWSKFDSPDVAMQSQKQQCRFTLLQTGHNGGYGYGNNVGIKYALRNGADYVLVLNNDTEVDPDFLEPLVQMCEDDPSVGIASGQIFYHDRPDVFWFNGGSFNNCTGRVKHIDYGKKNIGQKPLENSTFITGCLWLIPRHVLETVGLINEEYFMYVEDLEFCQRVLRQGYVLRVSERSHIYHKVGSSSGGELTRFSIYWRTRNWLLFMRNNMEPKCWIFGFYNGVIKLTMKALINMKFELLLKQFKAVNDVLKIKRNRMFKIAIIEPIGGHGGMVDYDFNILRSIKMQTDYDAILYTCDETLQHEAVKLVYRNIYGKTNKFIRAMNYLKGTFKALLDAKRNKALVVHLHLISFGFLEYCNLIMARKIFGFHVVGTVHDVESFEKYAKGDTSRHNYEKFISLLDAVVVHTEYAKVELVKNLEVEMCKGRRIETIFGPDFDFDSLDTNFIEKSIARKHLKLPQDKKIILFFGQIKKVKGLDLLLEAFGEVVKQDPDVLLVIAGKVWKDDYTEYEMIIKQHGLHDFVDQRIGFIDNADVPYYFNAVDVIALPYRKIYNSGVLIKAMSFGTPVVASDFGPFKEFIAHGENGFLFETRNAGSLAEKFQLVLNDQSLLDKISLAEKNFIKKYFSLDEIGRQYGELYTSVLSEVQ